MGRSMIKNIILRYQNYFFSNFGLRVKTVSITKTTSKKIEALM